MKTCFSNPLVFSRSRRRQNRKKPNECRGVDWWRYFRGACVSGCKQKEGGCFVCRVCMPTAGRPARKMEHITCDVYLRDSAAGQRMTSRS